MNYRADMFRKRSGSADPFGVGVGAVSAAVVVPERLVDLLAEASEPVVDAPPSIMDQRRDQFLTSMEALGVDIEELAEAYDLGRDYQFDHPISHVDRTLDAAFVPAGMSAETVELVAPLVEGLALRRVARYVTRAAARARMTADPQLADAAMRAYALTAQTRDKDARDDMVALAPVHVAANQVRRGKADLGVLGAVSPPQQRAFVEGFASRRDVTLASFGWIEVELAHGVWIVPDR